MDLQFVTVGELKYLDQPDRVLLKEIIARQGEPPAIEDKAVQPARATADGGQAETMPARREPLIQMRQNAPVSAPTVFTCRK